jgi:hypothetical protein
MRERRQTYRIRVPSQEPIQALLYIGGRDVPVELKDESLEGFGITVPDALAVAEGEEVHLKTPQGWFAATVVRVIWNSDGSVYVGLRRGPSGRPAGRRNSGSLSRTTLILAVAAGALIVPLLTLFFGQSPGRSSQRKSAPPPSIPVEKTVAVSPAPR